MQLQEDSGETGKKKYVNFKRVVWHKAFYEILKSVEQYAEIGYHLATADIEHGFFQLCLLHLQTMRNSNHLHLQISLNFTIYHAVGSTANFSVQSASFWGISLPTFHQIFPFFFSSDMEKIHKSTKGLSAGEIEEILKNVGPQDVEVMFK